MVLWDNYERVTLACNHDFLFIWFNLWVDAASLNSWFSKAFCRDFNVFNSLKNSQPEIGSFNARLSFFDVWRIKIWPAVLTFPLPCFPRIALFPTPPAPPEPLSCSCCHLIERRPISLTRGVFTLCRLNADLPAFALPFNSVSSIPQRVWECWTSIPSISSNEPLGIEPELILLPGLLSSFCFSCHCLAIFFDVCNSHDRASSSVQEDTGFNSSALNCVGGAVPEAFSFSSWPHPPYSGILLPFQQGMSNAARCVC